MPADLPEFANRLRHYREAAELSVRDLAKLSGVSSSAISHYENGHRRPKPGSVSRLALALRVRPEDIDPYLPYEIPGEPHTCAEPSSPYHPFPTDPEFHRLSALWPDLDEADRLELLSHALRLKRGHAKSDDSASACTLSA